MNSIITPDQAIVALVVPLVIQLMKKSGSGMFSWIQQNTPIVSAVASGVFAMLTTLGLHFTYNPDAHTLLITGLDPNAILTTLLGSAMTQFTVQHSAYEGIWRNLFPVMKLAPKG